MCWKRMQFLLQDISGRGGHDALIGHRNSGRYRVPPFPTALGRRTVVL